MSPAATPLLSIPVGVVVARRNAASPWIDYTWAPVAVLHGVPETEAWTVLRDEGEEYAKRLKEAGVAVTFRTVPGQFHGFFTMGKLLNQANIAAAEIGAWLRALN